MSKRGWSSLGRCSIFRKLLSQDSYTASELDHIQWMFSVCQEVTPEKFTSQMHSFEDKVWKYRNLRSTNYIWWAMLNLHTSFINIIYIIMLWVFHQIILHQYRFQIIKIWIDISFGICLRLVIHKWTWFIFLKVWPSIHKDLYHLSVKRCSWFTETQHKFMLGQRNHCLSKDSRAKT